MDRRDHAPGSQPTARGHLSIVGLTAAAALIEAGAVALLSTDRPASHVPEYISFYVLASVGYVAACWVVTRRRTPLRGRRILVGVWVAAIAFRLTVLPLAPSLSEDSTRYRWQGQMQEAGGDPYLDTPNDARWNHLRDATWPRVAGKDKPSAYGPILEHLNLWFYRAIRLLDDDPWKQLWWLKIPFSIADLGVGLALMALLASMGLPRSRVLVYLWSPLPVTEFWIEGHNDSVAVMLAVAALALVVRGRSDWAVAVAAAGALCKYWPVFLLPFLALHRTRAGWRVEFRGLAVAAVLAVCACWPYRGSIASVQDTLLGFAGHWRNNDSIFALLLLAAGGHTVVAATLSKLGVAASVARIRMVTDNPVKGSLAVLCALLFLAPNCFPWYLTWFLPLLAVYPVAPLLLWTALVVLAYHVVPGYEVLGTWTYDPTLTLIQYAPVLLWLAALAAHRSLLRRRSAR